MSSAITGVIIGLVSSFGSIILISLIIFLVWLSGCIGSGRILLDRFGRPGEYDDEQAFARDEAEALENMDDMARTEYLRAKGTYAAKAGGMAQQGIANRPHDEHASTLHGENQILIHAYS